MVLLRLRGNPLVDFSWRQPVFLFLLLKTVAAVRVYSPKGDVELAVGESRSGGVILIHDERKFPPGVESPFPRVVIGVNENGSGELLTRDKNGNRVK